MSTTPGQGIRITLYSRTGCHLCEEMRAVVLEVGRQVPLELEEIDIDGDPTLRARYDTDIPVLAVNGHDAFRHWVSPTALRDRLGLER